MPDDENPSGNEMHNVAARAGTIRNGFKTIADLEAEIAAVTEKYLTPLRKARTKAWRNLKKDVDIPREDLEPMYRVYRRARTAMELEHDGTLDNLREVQQSLQPGGSVDWVAVVNGEYDQEVEAAAE